VTTSLDRRERAELCDLFDELGPDAPTLCEGWTTADLAAHLVIRERDLRAGPGIVLGGRFAAYTEKLQQRAKATGYATTVGKVRSGPPIGPFAIPGLGAMLNLNEYFVHHEDVRRANGRGPRTDRPDLDDALWSQLKRMARFQLRKIDGAGVELARPDGDTIAAKRGEPLVRIVGAPGDLVLFLNGRKGAAQVELEGPADAVAAVRGADLGI
jgi:uncharacterized protein (TIGR03085 family)